MVGRGAARGAGAVAQNGGFRDDDVVFFGGGGEEGGDGHEAVT